MPPTRRSKPSTRAQSTLAFGPNSSNKVTKPLPPPPTTGKKSKSPKPSPKPSSKSSSSAAKLHLLDEITTPSPPHSPAPEEKQSPTQSIPESPRTLAIRNQHQSPKSQKSKAQKGETDDKAITAAAATGGADSVEETALKIPETQIRKYWQHKEEERIAPRVHQGGLSINEKILRHFDLSSQYGPCIGIPRLRRWKRAEGLGLKPPIEVLAVLVREEGKGNRGAERAFMDGLLASRVSGGD